jgi:hypothetical protein
VQDVGSTGLVASGSKPVNQMHGDHECYQKKNPYHVGLPR